MYTILKLFEKGVNLIYIFFKKIYYKIKYGKNLKFGKNIIFRKDFIINIKKGGKLEIGDMCAFNNYCSINVHNKVIIGTNNMFGEGVKIYDHNHAFCLPDAIKRRKEFVSNPIVIGNNNWFGTNTIILSKAAVGDNCVIGAGTILNEKISSGTLVSGLNRDIKKTPIKFKNKD